MTEAANSQQVPSRVECPAKKDPSVRWFIMAGMLLVFGVYCFIDHFIRGKYPYADPSDLNAYLKYVFNHYGAIVFTAVGVVLLVVAIVTLRRRLLADQEGIGYAGKEKIPWSAFTKIDSADLADKGILRLTYAAGGKTETLVLDSWKLQNFRDLVALVESKIPAGEAEG
jgi:hypothetical protein